MTSLLLFTLAAAADFSGSYTMHMREVGSELLLKPDGTFEYMFAYGAADYWAKGTWQADKDMVILKSVATNNEKAFRLVKSVSTSENTIQVRLSPAVPDIDVALVTTKGRAEARTDSKGVARFDKSPGLKGGPFAVPVYRFESGMIAVNAAHNDFTFELNGKSITEVRFSGEALRLEGKTLHMRNWGGGTQPMLYVKND